MNYPLISKLQTLGIQIIKVGSEFILRAPKGTLTKELIEEVQRHKDELFTTNSGDDAREPTTGYPLDENNLTFLTSETSPHPGFTHEATPEEPSSPTRTSMASFWPVPTDPMGPAHQAYRRAVEEVGGIWDGMVAAGAPVPSLDPAEEDQLDEAVASRFRARDLPGALAGIEAWRRAWMAILQPEVVPEDSARDSNIVGAAARRIDGARLADLAGDPDVPAKDRRLYRGELDRRAQAILDEAEGRVPHPNQAVWNQFARTTGGLVDCSKHRHWLSASRTPDIAGGILL